MCFLRVGQRLRLDGILKETSLGHTEKIKVLELGAKGTSNMRLKVRVMHYFINC